MPERRNFHIGSFAYTAGAKVTMDVPREGVIRKITLRLRFTITTTTSVLAAPRFQALARLIRNLSFNVNGRDTVLSASGEGLVALARTDRGIIPDGMEDTVVLTAAPTTTAYDVNIPVYRMLPRSMSPLLCADDLRRASLATLELTWGSISDIVNTVGGGVLSAVSCDVAVEYMVGLPNEAQFNVRQISEQEESYSAAGDLDITVAGRTGLDIHSLHFIATDDYVGSNDLITQLKLQSGAGKIWQDRRSGELQGTNKEEIGLEAILAGLWYMPVLLMGDPRTAIRASDQPADLLARLTVAVGSATERIKTVTEAVRPLVA